MQPSAIGQAAGPQIAKADGDTPVQAYIAAMPGWKGDVGPLREVRPLPVTSGQLAHEWRHLQRKLEVRNVDTLSQWSCVTSPDCHPLFRLEEGPIASWERVRKVTPSL